VFLACRPDPRLAPYVLGYWFVEDLRGEHEGRPIRTAPHPGAVLSVNFGRPNAMEGGPLVPRASLLGVQTVGRGWRSWSGTYFVMAMLTAPGLARLFPASGDASADALLDLGGLLGDGPARALGDDLGAAWRPRRVRERLDRWLLARLDSVAPPPELPRLAAACDLLRAGRRVDAAAASVGVTRRQLGRWFRGHLGVGPKRLADLERLHASLRAVQRGRGDPLAGFSDQAHQIRTWRARLGVSPGAYARGVPSPMAGHFGASGEEAPAFYL
jgi:AraC-like DNA-binding protein